MGEEEQYSHRRAIPQNELDLNMMTTDSVWGKSEVSPELRKRLEQLYIEDDGQGIGTNIVTKESLWGLLGFYTRDMRLANLSEWNGELNFCHYHLDLANDFLQTDQVKPFLICLSRVATRLELSQSKGGFLRKKMNTFTQENVNRLDEPPKKSLFGTGKKQEGGRY